MLQLPEILALINKKGKQKIPPIIQTWRGVYYGMSLHIDGACPAFYDLRYNAYERVYLLSTTQTIPNNYFGIAYQEIFDRYLFSRHPREPEVTRQWRMSQYKPFTQSPFKRVIQTITGAIFQDSGYSITVDDSKDNDYIWGNNFDGKNIVGYIVSKFKSICTDPNGCFVVIPKDARYETANEVKPQIHFIPSKFIRWHSKDEIIFEIDEIIWAVNSIGYLRFGKIGDTQQYYHIDEAEGGYYAHMMYRMPVIVAGGEWNEHGFYESHLQSAKPLADEFVGTMSALQMVNKEASHPFIIEADTKCTECGGIGSIEGDCGCSDGYCDTCKGHKLNAPCNICHGAGRMSRNPADRLIAPADDLKNELIQIVNPSVDVNKFHTEYVDKLYDDILEALNLHYIDQAQSGVAKDKDMETRYQFISNINNDIFDRLIPQLLDAILYLRNVRVEDNNITPYKPEYTLVKPSQFQLKTSYDLVEEYKLATESKLPGYILEAISVDYTDKQFGGNEALKKKAIVINGLDTLAVMTPDDISVVMLNGGASVRDLQFHVQVPKIIDKIRRDKTDDWFIAASFNEIEALVNQEFAKVVPLTPQIDDTQERIIA